MWDQYKRTFVRMQFAILLVTVGMPSFFGYTVWSLAILVPLFAVVALVFFR